jgi:serine/threonine-protein kinase RsbT
MKGSDPSRPKQSVPIASDVDIVAARLAARAVATELGFTGADLVMIATAVSEVARNILEYARPGVVTLSVLANGQVRGLEIVAADGGPGITDVTKAMEDGFSTGRGLGLGLPGARRLMDEFVVDSSPGRGTTITMKKWLL